MESRPDVSIVLTVYNRPELMLLNVLMGLAKCAQHEGTGSMEIVLVNDGSTRDYSMVWESCDGALEMKRLDIDTVKERPDAYHIDGYNNPAHAFNTGFRAASGRVVFLMSSDVMLVPYAIASARKHDLTKCVWSPRVVDIDSGMEYVGESRIFPVQFFLGTARENWPDPPFDEEYLKGIAFDDNDLAANVALKTGKVIIDTDVTVLHQSHPPSAYRDDLKGWTINQDYTLKKWGGIPWDLRKSDPLKYEPTRVAGTLIVKVARK